jgi:hypothetical protein
MASTWGEPEISNSSPMQGPAQISAVADYAMAVGVRHFPTVSALGAAQGAVLGYLAVAESVPGALWRYNGSTWEMMTPGQFDTSADRNSAFSAPQQGYMAYTRSTGILWRYYAAYNVNSNPGGARLAGWYPEPGSEIFVTAARNEQVVWIGPADRIPTFGKTGSLFKAPTGNTPLTDMGTFYQNEFFIVYKDGAIVPRIEGRYDFEANIQFSNQSTVNQAYFMRDVTSIENGPTNLGGVDAKGQGDAAEYLRPLAPNVPVGAGVNAIYLVLRNNTPGAATGAGFGPYDASAMIRVRWLGPRQV